MGRQSRPRHRDGCNGGASTMGTPNEMRRIEGNKDTMIERHLGRNTLMQKTHLP